MSMTKQVQVRDYPTPPQPHPHVVSDVSKLRMRKAYGSIQAALKRQSRKMKKARLLCLGNDARTKGSP